jgi:hypothetical protein
MNDKSPAKISGRSTKLRCLMRCGLVAVLSLLPMHAAFSQGQPVRINTETAARDGRVWGALVFASDAKPEGAHAPPAEFPDLFKRLGKAFPYKHYHVIGEHNQPLFREYETWVVPSKDFFLKLDSKGVAKRGGINMQLQFWQGQKVLVKTDVVLQPGSPLFIQGPKWRDGHIVFVLVLKKVEAHPRK